MKGASGTESQSSFVWVLILPSLRAGRCVEESKKAFEKQMEVVQLLNEVDHTSWCVGVRDTKSHDLKYNVSKKA